MKKILVLGAGHYYTRILTLLKEANFYVLAVDRDADAAGKSIAHEFKAIDFSKSEEVLEWAKEKEIDGVMPINDFGTRTAAYVSEKMGLPGINMETAIAANDKGIMRDCWQKAGLSNPEYCVFSSLKELKSAVEKIGFPCVVKPTDCGGSGRGISVLKSADDVEWAYEFAKPYVKNNRFIVEEFVEGREMTIETISINGEVHVLAMSDQEKAVSRTRVSTSISYPSNLGKPELAAVKKLVSDAVLAVGIENGMGHTEVIVTESGPKLVEIGARGGGGHIFHTIIEAVSGINAPVAFAKLLTGTKVEINDISEKGAVYRFFVPEKRGVLKAIKNVELARNLEGVLDIYVAKKVGDEFGFLENSLHRAGYVVTHGVDRAAAVKVADEAEALVEFVIA